MRKINKIGIIILLLNLIVLTVTTVNAGSFNLKKYGDFKYDSTMGGVEIKYYTGKKKTVTIPARIKKKKVVSVSLIKAPKVKKIKISKYVRNVCLSRNRLLKKVTVDKKSKYLSVKNNMVLNKKKTKLISILGGYDEIKIPTTVKKIGISSFYNSKVKKVTISKNVNTIMSSAFEDCKKLNEFVFEGNAIPKLEYAFMYNTAENVKFYVKNKELADDLLKELNNKVVVNAHIYVGNDLIYSQKIQMDN